MKPTFFIRTLHAAAQAVHASKRLYASVNLAQIALETGWLAHLPHDIQTGKNSFNLYGIKGTGPAGSVYDYTYEYSDGKWMTVLAQFAAYSSYLQSMLERVEFLQQNSRYQPVFKANSAIAQAYALQDCGWATDPKYAEKLTSIIADYRLTQYDLTAFRSFRKKAQGVQKWTCK